MLSGTLRYSLSILEWDD